MMRRRRKNPSALATLNGALPLLALAGGAWVFIEYILPLIQGIGKTAGAAYDSATTGIANLFPGTAPQVPGLMQNFVRMPDGSSFPTSNLTSLNFRNVNGQQQFDFAGATYALTPQVNGYYGAIPI